MPRRKTRAAAPTRKSPRSASSPSNPSPKACCPCSTAWKPGLKIDNASAEQLREGTEATLRQLLSVLERNKVVEVNPAPGARFDPAQQQAISMVPAQQDAGTVVMVLQKGYTIAERVLRPALVTVAQ
jgi:molecular chaperone GrpE